MTTYARGEGGHGLGTGRRAKKTASSADSPAQDDSYVPPPANACNVVETLVDLRDEPDTGTRHELHYRANHYRENIVDFCLEQVVVIDDQKYKVMRIDTSHGTVHIHRFTKSDQQGRKKTLCTIPPYGHDVVNAQYDELLTWCLDHWEENLRRFRDAE